MHHTGATMTPTQLKAEFLAMLCTDAGITTSSVGFAASLTIAAILMIRMRRMPHYDRGATAIWGGSMMVLAKMFLLLLAFGTMYQGTPA
ncbi:hypothetical protein HON52_01885 [Candidatus Uhrbacteria bacterium]|jgi:hypothetical protein|nr:hypothetical protein [Candidatus Uhrbacteria bacterium]